MVWCALQKSEATRMIIIEAVYGLWSFIAFDKAAL